MRVAMLGLGLIGGSVARAAIAAGADVRAWTPGGAGPRAAEADGIRAAAGVAEAVEGADLVVLAAPPLACLELVDELGRGGVPLGPDTVVTDVASTKAGIVSRLAVTSPSTTRWTRPARLTEPGRRSRGYQRGAG